MGFGSNRRRQAGLRAAPKQPARSYALWLLSQREYSASALFERLVGRGYSQDEAQAALELLQRHGLQSDERFASMKARASALRAGNRRIAMQLSQAGIDPDTVAGQLEALEPEADRALVAARRFAGDVRDVRTRARFWRYLASRGFPMSVVSQTWQAMACEMREPSQAASEESENAAEDASDWA